MRQPLICIAVVFLVSHSHRLEQELRSNPRPGEGTEDCFFMSIGFFDSLVRVCFLLENVQGLETADEGRALAVILQHLYSLSCYNIYWSLVNTKDNGVPQNRPR